LLLSSLGARAEETALQQYLRARLESLEVFKSLRIDGVELAAKAPRSPSKSRRGAPAP